MFFGAALLGLAAASAAMADLKPRAPTQRCAATAKRAPATLEGVLGARTELEKSEESKIEVDVYFHIVASSKDEKDGYISDSTLDKQLKVLNTDYTKAGISFKHGGTDRTVDESWANDGDEMAMKRKLRRGDYRDLNIYYLTRPDNDTLGYSAYPLINVQSGTDEFYEDGCVILASTVPGGSREGYDMGKTTTHEVGHWFGLFHPFEGGCGDPGDHVDDTPPQKEATEGCPAVAPNSCPDKPGTDGIHNFMDYASDSCMREFTPGQISRMRGLWNEVRSKAN